MEENIKQSVETIHITIIANENERNILNQASLSFITRIPLSITIKSPVPSTSEPIPRLQNAQKITSEAE
tara:strand:- start:29 stop:235 length:207 start_codon:yes stop_codon:yes gene_type:complete